MRAPASNVVVSVEPEIVEMSAILVHRVGVILSAILGRSKALTGPPKQGCAAR
jgi:hypothetical protein